MNLQPVDYPTDTRLLAFNLWLTCLKCGQKKKPFQMNADLDGEPYKAYYCKDCSELALNYPVVSVKSN